MLLAAGTTVWAEPVTIDSVNDATIDQHVNWNNGLKGIQTYWTSIPGADQNAHQQLDVGRLHSGYSNPVVGPTRWGLVKFDVSGVDPATIIDNATFRVIQTIPLGFNATTNIYAVNVDWNEGTPDGDPANQPDPSADAFPVNGVSWVNFIGSAGSLGYDPIPPFLTLGDVTFLGTMVNNSGPTSYSDAGLAALVQGWVDGSISNYGLLLTWEGAAPTDGANDMCIYATHEDPVNDPPQLILNGTVEDPEPPDQPPGVVVAYSPPASEVYLGDPSIAILPNGHYIVSHDAWGPNHQYSQTYVYRSSDAGATWAYTAGLYGQYQSSLFMHNGDLYIIGGSNHGSDIGIRKSMDNGDTWTTPSSSTNGRLLTGGNYAMGATPPIVHNGRIWRAIEEIDPTPPPCCSREFCAMMLSAPVGSDLMNAANWTASNSVQMYDYLPPYAWFEGGAVVKPDGNMAIMLRVSYGWEQAAIADVSADGTTVSYNAATALVDFYGGQSKFTIRYDEQTDRYWSLVSKRSDPYAVRNILALTSSADLINWTVEQTVLQDPDQDYVGFQYADFVFEGNDIIFVSRTAYDGAPNFHDSNYITFHRIEDFRANYPPLVCGDPGTVYLPVDLDKDCRVDWGDFSIFASYWLYDNCQTPDFCGGADMDQSSLVDWGDFSIFASQWLWCTDPADPNCDQYWR